VSAVVVVIVLPVADDDPGLGQGPEGVGVQAFVGHWELNDSKYPLRQGSPGGMRFDTLSALGEQNA
jgi:hypothetical protein